MNDAVETSPSDDCFVALFVADVNAEKPMVLTIGRWFGSVCTVFSSREMVSSRPEPSWP